MSEQQEKPMKLYVSGLVGPMMEFTEADIKRIFSSFGPVDMVDLKRCPYTERSLGVCYIQFKRASNAREAMSCMHGYEIAGLPLKVGYVSQITAIEEDDPMIPDSQIASQQQRLQLMHAMLTGEKASDSSSMHSCLLVTNAFDVRMALRSDARRFFDDLVIHIENECKKYGKVEKVWVDKLSPNASVWIAFAIPRYASVAHEAMDGRNWGGRQLAAELVDRATFDRALVK
jgi:RNA-binding protein 23/39